MELAECEYGDLSDIIGNCYKCQTVLYKNKAAPCETCERPALSRGNIEAYSLIQKYGSLMVNENGVSPEGIKFILDEEGYTNPTDRLILIRKLSTYFATARHVSMKEATKPSIKSDKSKGTMGGSK